MSETELLCLAHNTSDVEILKILAVNESYEVRAEVAENENTPKEALEMLAKEEYSVIRWAVAKHKNTPADALAELATDIDYLVRSAVANNPNTPYKTLLMLSKDNIEWVSEKAENALKKRKEKSKTSMER